MCGGLDRQLDDDEVRMRGSSSGVARNVYDDDTMTRMSHPHPRPRNEARLGKLWATPRGEPSK